MEFEQSKLQHLLKRNDMQVSYATHGWTLYVNFGVEIRSSWNCLANSYTYENHNFPREIRFLCAFVNTNPSWWIKTNSLVWLDWICHVVRIALREMTFPFSIRTFEKTSFTSLSRKSDCRQVRNKKRPLGSRSLNEIGWVKNKQFNSRFRRMKANKTSSLVEWVARFPDRCIISLTRD